METSNKKKALFAVAVEVRDRKNRPYHTSIEYIHADDVANARYKFRLTCPNTQKFHVVSIGQVIGYKVEDNKGNVLSV